MSDDTKVPVNFRLSRKSKQALDRLAAKQQRAVSEVVREVLESYVAREERRAWEAEARRAAQVLANEARRRTSPEAVTLRTLDANLKEYAKEWVWDDDEEKK
jgi:predicted DNA-binding protein